MTIENVDNELLEKSQELEASKGMMARTLASRSAELSHFNARVIESPRDAQLSQKDGKIVRDLKTKVIQLYPRGIQCDAAMHEYVAGCVDKVMRHVFRIAPDHQDYKLEWLGDDEIIPIPSYCIQVVGIADDNTANPLLMKAAVLINELVSKKPRV